MLKEGDILTLSVGYPLMIAEFQYLKPHASITRKLSDDLVGDLRDMGEQVRLALRRSLVCCIEELSEVAALLDETGGDIDLLAERLTQELENVTKGASIEVKTSSGEKKAHKKAAKKKPGKKKKLAG